MATKHTVLEFQKYLLEEGLLWLGLLYVEVAIYIIFGLVISNLFYLDFTWARFAHSFIRACAVIVIIISELLGRRWCLPHFIIKSCSNSTLRHAL